jgi:hypothetical protein
MAESLHPAAPHHLPSFITAPGETDVLLVVMGLVLLLAIMLFGSLFFRLHSLPERVAHKSHKIQFEVVAVLCLIALFTHMHIFWVAALLLAMIDVPDFGTSFARIAGSAEKIAGLKPGEGAYAPPQAIKQADEARATSLETRGAVTEGDGAALPTKPDIPPAGQKELSNA